jgi:hypothetical protein
MRRLGLALLVVAGCKSGPQNGYAVDLTLVADASISDAALAAARSLDVAAGGADQGHRVYPLAHPFADHRQERLIYRPGAHAGTLVLTATVSDAAGNVLGSGTTSVALHDGQTMLATLTLSAGGPRGDLGAPADLGVPDLAVDLAVPSDDLAVPADLSVVPDLAPACPACPSATPICDSGTHSCRKCAAHAECPSGVCVSDGSCAAPATVLYIDNANGTCMGTHTGMQADPLCNAPQPLPDPTQLYVHVAGSNTAYTYFDVTLANPATLTFVGPGRNAATPAIVQGAGPTSGTFAVTDSSAGATVLVDGLTADGSAGSGAGFWCTGAATTHMTVLNSAALNTATGSGIHVQGCAVTARYSTLSGSNNFGVSVQAGSATVDACLVTNNKGGGLRTSTTAAQLTVTNSILTGNSQQLMNLANGSMVTFAFNTAVKNGTNATFNCPGNPSTLEASIILGNGAAGGTQFGSGCRLLNVVTGTDTAVGAIQLSPTFVNANGGDYHLLAGDPANVNCCFNKITGPEDGGIAVLPDHDIDGQTRPLGAGWEIGADEVQ